MSAVVLTAASVNGPAKPCHTGKSSCRRCKVNQEGEWFQGVAFPEYLYCSACHEAEKDHLRGKVEDVQSNASESKAFSTKSGLTFMLPPEIALQMQESGSDPTALFEAISSELKAQASKQASPSSPAAPAFSQPDPATPVGTELSEDEVKQIREEIRVHVATMTSWLERMTTYDRPRLTLSQAEQKSRPQSLEVDNSNLATKTRDLMQNIIGQGPKTKTLLKPDARAIQKAIDNMISFQSVTLEDEAASDRYF